MRAKANSNLSKNLLRPIRVPDGSNLCFLSAALLHWAVTGFVDFIRYLGLRGWIYRFILPLYSVFDCPR